LSLPVPSSLVSIKLATQVHLEGWPLKWSESERPHEPNPENKTVVKYTLALWYIYTTADDKPTQKHAGK